MITNNKMEIKMEMILKMKTISVRTIKNNMTTMKKIKMTKIK